MDRLLNLDIRSIGKDLIYGHAKSLITTCQISNSSIRVPFYLVEFGFRVHFIIARIVEVTHPLRVDTHPFSVGPIRIWFSVIKYRGFHTVFVDCGNVYLRRRNGYFRIADMVHHKKSNLLIAWFQIPLCNRYLCTIVGFGQQLVLGFFMNVTKKTDCQNG